MTASTSLKGQSTSDESAIICAFIDYLLELQKVIAHKIRRVETSSHVRVVPELRGTGDRGYSLYNGPWSYYVKEKSLFSGRVWQPLAD